MEGKMAVVSDEGLLEARALEYGHKLGRYTKLLNERYLQCDTKGHLKPGEDGMCGYCYRHLKYMTPHTDSIRDMRKDVRPEWQPCDAAKLFDMDRHEVEMQKGLDWQSGMRKLMEELEG